MKKSMAVVEIRDLVKRFPKEVGKRFLLWPVYDYVTAVDRISFDVEDGEILGLLGPNGAGKTTTVRLICGILAPDDGEVRVFGRDPRREREKVVSRIGAVFGHKGQLPANLKVIDAVRVISMYYDVKKEEFEERFWSYARVLGVDHLAERRVRQLSLGERMRFEIIAALIHDPDLLILDEPTIGLDFPSKRKIRELLRTSEKTIIFTSHDAMDIEEVCERVIILNKGKIVVDTTVDELKRLLGYKYVEIVLEKEPYFVPKNWEVLEGNRLRGKVKSWDEVAEILEKMKDFGILDVTLTYPSVEEVLTHVYTDSGGFKEGNG